MRLITLAACIGIASIALAQEPFERYFLLPDVLKTSGATLDDDGNILSVSQTGVGAGDAKNIQVTSLSPTGEHNWTKKYTVFIDNGTYHNSIAVGREGVIVLGWAMGQGTNSRDALVLRINPENGELLDTPKRIDVGNLSNAFHALQRIDNGFIATGRTDIAGSQYDMQLAKLNEFGEVQWSKAYGSPGWDWGYEAKPVSTGGYILVGYGDSLGTGFSPSGYVVRTDDLGNELWARSVSSGNGVDELYTVAEDIEGNLYVGGRSLGYEPGNVNAFLVKMTSTGNHIWTRYLKKGIQIEELKPNPNGGVDWLMGPDQFFVLEDRYDMVWGTFDADGNMTASHYHAADSANDVPFRFFQNPAGGYTIMGMINLNEDPNWQLDLIVTDGEGNSACNDIEVDLNWQVGNALVQPFTSITSSGFDTYSFPMFEENVSLQGVTNPCCFEDAHFDKQQQDDPFTWQFTDQSEGANSYFWDFGDGNTSTEANPTHTYSTSGDYMVCLTITGDCGDDMHCEQISITVGIDEFESTAGIRLYPSPANEQLTINSQRSAIQAAQIIDLSGSLVKQVREHRSQTLVLPTAELPAGLYALRLILADGTLHNQRFMIAH